MYSLGTCPAKKIVLRALQGVTSGTSPLVSHTGRDTTNGVIVVAANARGLFPRLQRFSARIIRSGGGGAYTHGGTHVAYCSDANLGTGATVPLWWDQSLGSPLAACHIALLKKAFPTKHSSEKLAAMKIKSASSIDAARQGCVLCSVRRSQSSVEYGSCCQSGNRRRYFSGRLSLTVAGS